MIAGQCHLPRRAAHRPFSGRLHRTTRTTSTGSNSSPAALTEIGYWVGVPYWNHGYCTDAARAVLQYGFEVLALQRVFSHHLTRNPASGRVMRKLGMTHEGHHRRHVKKWDVFEDIDGYAILKSEWESVNTQAREQGETAS